jgi:DNA-binding GntR family transcriptional regulator
LKFTLSTNLANQIYQYISEKIIHSEIKPGERIIEEKISRELHVSRIPLREALRLLEKDGLIELMPRKGARVTVLTRTNIEYTYDILAQLYALMVRKLVSMDDEKCFTRINAAIDRLDKCAAGHDIEGFYEAIFNIGAVALLFLKAPILERMILELWPTKRRVEYYITTQKQEDLKEIVRLFRQTFHHARAGNTEQALVYLMTYMQSQKDYALAHVPLNFLKGIFSL